MPPYAGIVSLACVTYSGPERQPVDFLLPISILRRLADPAFGARIVGSRSFHSNFSQRPSIR